MIYIRRIGIVVFLLILYNHFALSLDLTDDSMDLSNDVVAFDLNVEMVEYDLSSGIKNSNLFDNSTDIVNDHKKNGLIELDLTSDIEDSALLIYSSDDTNREQLVEEQVKLDLTNDTSNDKVEVITVVEEGEREKLEKPTNSKEKKNYFLRWYNRYREPWYCGFFIDAFMSWYFIPPPLTDYAVAYPGFRGGIGYEYLGFIGEVRSGYTYIEGNHPMIVSSIEVPLSFHFNYDFRITNWFSIEPQLGIGVLFSEVTHYETAINLLIDKKTVSNGVEFFMSTEGRLNFALLNRSIIFFISIGLDYLQEKTGPVASPTLNVGVRIHPGRMVSPIEKLAKKIESKRREKLEPKKTTILEEDEIKKDNTNEEEHIEKNEEIIEIVVDDLSGDTIVESSDLSSDTTVLIEDETDDLAVKEEVLIEKIDFTIYFNKNSALLTREAAAELDNIVKLLSENSDSEFIISGYSAPFYSREARVAISRRRAYNCYNYIKDRYNIEPERVKVQYYGSENRGEGVVSIELYIKKEIRTSLKEEFENIEIEGYDILEEKNEQDEQ